MTAAALWLRGPAGQQDAADQLPGLERFTALHGYEVSKTYTVSETAWPGGQDGGQDGGEYQRALQQALDDARAGRFEVLIVWALDWIIRDGAGGVLRIIGQFRERGCRVVSVQEDWLNGTPEVQDVLVAFAGWMSQQESTRRSERIKAGLARRRAEGKPVGRQPGSGDKKPRQRSGYAARWERDRAAAR
jgi:DNA invertase Pin-like site-specific DNA recombinase